MNGKMGIGLATVALAMTAGAAELKTVGNWKIDFDEAMARGTMYKPFELKKHEETCNLFFK